MSAVATVETLFEARRRTAEPAALRRERAAALARWRALPEPTRLDEDWRRSDPRLFDPGELDVLPPAAPGGGFDDPLHEGFDTVVTLDESGFRIADRTGALRDGRLRVEPLAEAAARDGTDWPIRSGTAVRPELPPAALAPDRHEAWTDAFWNAGFAIEVAPEAVFERGVLLDIRRAQPGAWLGLRLAVRVGAGARLALAERLAAAAPGRGITAARREFFLDPGAQARVATVQALPAEAAYIAWEGARLGAGARLDWVTAPLGAGAVRTRAACDLAGADAEARLHGFVFGDGSQRVSQKTLQVHSAPDTRSSLLYRGVVKDAARSVFQGIIVARRDAQRIDAYQKNNHLVLDDGARAESLPGLLIDADDLRCSHGSTVGNLDPAQVLYLRSRGLSAVQARGLLIEGFAEEILTHVSNAALRAQVRRKVAAKLGAAPSLENAEMLKR